MSIHADVVWEIRAEGSNTNGGGFYDKNPGTSVDYSQQDSAQLALTDIASDGAGTGISSATGGFTAAMEGNVMYIAGGTGFTTGWYIITAYADTNNVTIDRSAGASKTGGTGNVGGAWAFGGSLDTDFSALIAHGNKVWIKSGTHTMSEAFKVYYVSDKHPIIIRGYKATRGDVCVGDDRPLIDEIGYVFTLQSFSAMFDLRFISEVSGRVYLSGDAITAYNCKFSDRGSAKTAHHLDMVGYGCKAIGCEFVASAHSSTQELTRSTVYGGMFISCWFHGSGNTNGVGCRYWSRTEFVNCVFSNLGQGALGGDSVSSPGAINCTFYNLGVGMAISYYYGMGIVNNIFHTCTTAISEATAYYGWSTQNNWFYNCTTIFSGGEPSHTDDVTDTDPLLTDPANDDFTLQLGSPCFDAGVSLNLTGLGG